MGIGEYAALGAALLWTVSSFLWGHVKLNAVELNICKNFVGAFLICGHVAVMLLLALFWAGDANQTSNPSAGESALSVSNDLAERQQASTGSIGARDDSDEIREEPFRLKASWMAWGWLTLSGVIGIVIGDTFYFRSLQILGPRRSLMVATTSPVFALLSGWMILSETLLGIQLLGIALTIFGVMVVIGDKRGEQEALQLFPGRQMAGVWMGVAGAICQGVGATISKLGMEVDDCSPLEAAMIRILVAAIGSVVILVSRKKAISFAKKFFKWELILQLIPPAAIGTWLGIWLSQIAFKETEVGIAQTLVSTSPLFAIPMVYFYQGHKTSAIAIVGTVIAILGVAFACEWTWWDWF